jgi:hypothetical protein
VGNIARGAGALPGLDPLTHPAAASTTAAASTAHHLSQRLEFASPVAGADRKPTMAIISCRARV